MTAPKWTATTVTGRALEAIERSGLSDTKAGRDIGAKSGYQMIRNWRKGLKKISPENAQALAERIAGCSYQALIAGAEDEASYPGGAARHYAMVAEPAVLTVGGSTRAPDDADWRKWVAMHLRARGFAEGSARWQRAWQRINNARGRQGAAPEMVEELVDLFIQGERGLSLDEAEGRADLELKRQELTERGITVQPPPPKPGEQTDLENKGNPDEPDPPKPRRRR